MFEWQPKNASVRELLTLTIYYKIKILHEYHIIMKILMYLYLLHHHVCLFKNRLRKLFNNIHLLITVHLQIR